MSGNKDNKNKEEIKDFFNKKKSGVSSQQSSNLESPQKSKKGSQDFKTWLPFKLTLRVNSLTGFSNCQ